MNEMKLNASESTIYLFMRGKDEAAAAAAGKRETRSSRSFFPKCE